jgi:hypothetical protein
LIDRARRQSASSQFINSAPVDYQFISPSNMTATQQQAYEANASQTRKLETERRHHAERYDKVLEDVIRMEVKLDITDRWQPSSPKYMETIKYMANRKYHQALDNLQRLVIQRLFELQKLNLSKTGLFNLTAKILTLLTWFYRIPYANTYRKSFAITM